MPPIEILLLFTYANNVRKTLICVNIQLRGVLRTRRPNAALHDRPTVTYVSLVLFLFIVHYLSALSRGVVSLRHLMYELTVSLYA